MSWFWENRKHRTSLYFFVVAMLGLWSVYLGSHPVWGEKLLLRQPDGTLVSGFIFGDEYHRRVETAEGYTIIRNEATGWLEFARLEGNRLVPSGLVVGRVDSSRLAAAGITKHLSDRAWVMEEIRRLNPEFLHDQIVSERVSAAALGPKALTGTRKMFIVAVEFQPEATPPTGWSKGVYNPEDFAARVFASEEAVVSLTNYYKANSGGLFWPVGSAYPRWVTLPYTASYYKSINSWTRIVEHALDQIKATDPSFDFASVANNGELDLALIWAGTRETWGSFFWPHMSSMNVNRYGIRVKTRIAVNERNSNGAENKDVGVFCHEYGHVTGAPDVYDYSTFHHRPLGMYCIMGYSNPRVGFSGYIRWKVYGWVEPVEINTSGVFKISALSHPSPPSSRLYKIPIDFNSDGTSFEYLLVENRLNGADPLFDTLPGRRDGLLITHVDERYSPAGCLPTYPFYGVEAISPELDPGITSLAPLNQLWGKHAWAADLGHTKLENFYPDARPAGAYLQLTSGDDTENIIFRNTQGHNKSRDIAIQEISFSAEEMTFKTRMLAAAVAATAVKVHNRSLLQQEYINILKWQPNPANPADRVAKYRVYWLEGGKEILIGEVESNRLELWHRPVSKDLAYTYRVVAVSSEGCEGQPALVGVK